eukprot:Gregarina_sp_Poly_1__10640@NODE_79_length_15751_cov_81_561464_g67_i0_p2_GENE_NODE_79_length_15751_cov_81_561464_g67_i0NODE_79_length_15751_cov_81_561464_g67_i0_p2_ORF_typecomplete_len1003_score189_42PRP1_N/PF06424_12/7_2e43TPR_15/PF13429_6/3_4e03TPR_15/PF13429_6/3_1e05TPR_15/PF13429_6/0_00085TPR_15/PF13429_6/2_8e09TPR_15/PF13429_6/5_9e06TPR_15/PF13429_6/1_6e05Suf/PF05843_14/0_0032Suf/PF05843_14/0_0024Suf/PF05843_14/0_049Suf/PF05843_14/7_1e07Suf/PF05843_14/5_8e10Suf/PF05843_14/6ChAPs/PF09295_10/0
MSRPGEVPLHRPQFIGPVGGNLPTPSGAVLSRTSVTAAPPRPPVKDQWGTPPPGYVPGRGRGATGFAGGVSRDDTSMEQDRGDYSDRNFDEFSGYNENLFKDSEYDEDDRQADILYDSIDVTMDMRRRSRREQRLKEELARKRAQNPTIHQQFSDLKQSLASVTREEWEALPDIGDTVQRAKRKAPTRYARAPDSLLLEAQEASRLSSTAVSGLATPIGATLTPLPGTASTMSASGLTGGFVTPVEMQTPFGMMTPMGLRTPLETFGLRDVGEARGAALGAKLDSVVETPMTHQSVVDPKGYLTALNSLKGNVTGMDLDNLSKARSLMKSITQTNPKDPPGWIAYARLEERAGRMKQALHIIAEGCSMCPKDEEVWLEAARLAKPSQAKEFLTVATHKFLPNSVRLWVERASREENADAKRRVLKQALGRISNSVRLWQEAVALEDTANARVLLHRAVECIPQSVELWLKLADLSSHLDAKKALNEARKKCPASSEIWVAAAQLEETRAQLSEELLTRLISNGIKRLRDHDVEWDRQLWLSHAEASEAKGCVATCRAIVAAAAQHLDASDVNPKVFKRLRLEEAERAVATDRPETARAILQETLKVMPGKKAVWLAYVELETHLGRLEQATEVLRQATQACPSKEIFWLMLAKQQWVRGDADAARSSLLDAGTKIADSEAILLALVKVERETSNIEAARTLLRAREGKLDTAAVWMQSVQLERRLRDYEAARSLVTTSLQRHPRVAKLWLIAAAVEWERPGGPFVSEAVSVFERAVQQVPGSVPVWVSFIDLYIRTKHFARGRTVREKASLLLPEEELIWFKAVEIEKLDPDSPKGMAQQMVSRALQRCPKSGLLLCEAVWLEDKVKRGAKVFEALTKSERDPSCVEAAARVFWEDNKVKKAREWFLKTHELGPRYGDAYGSHLAFEIERGEYDRVAEIFRAASEAEPNEGLRWNSVAKRVENWGKSVPEKLLEFVKECYPSVLGSTQVFNELLALAKKKPF